MRYTEDSLIQAVEDLGWDVRNDDIHVEIGGTQVYEINGAGSKWAPVKGTRKYNKDAFIVIKNRSRDPLSLVKQMSNPNQLYEDMQRLDDLYEELLWHPDDELQFTHDGEKIIITNKTLEKQK